MLRPGRSGSAGVAALRSWRGTADFWVEERTERAEGPRCSVMASDATSLTFFETAVPKKILPSVREGRTVANDALRALRALLTQCSSAIKRAE